MANDNQKTKCPKCGLPGSGRFCLACGASLTGETGAGGAAPGRAGAQPAGARPAEAGLVRASFGETPTARSTWAPTAPSIPPVSPPVPPSVQPPTAQRPVAPTVSEPKFPGGPAFAEARSVEQEAKPVAPGELQLEADSLCILFENVKGMARFRLCTCEGDVFDNVTLKISDKVTQDERIICENRMISCRREFDVPIAPKKAGPVIWDIRLEYEFEGKRHSWEGEWATIATGREGARQCAESIVVNINTNITTGHASEVHNSQDAASKLREALEGRSDDMFEALRTIVVGTCRAYRRIDLYARSMNAALPPIPAEAACERLTVNLGVWKMTLFSERTVTFGRSQKACDIAMHPREGAELAEEIPYRMISRGHCRFAHNGTEVIVEDGVCDESGRVNPSRHGTFFNGDQIEGELRLSASGTKDGMLTFGGAGGSDVVGMKAKVLTAGCLCETCPRGDRMGCQGGKRPSLLLRRTDGQQECFVALWSCVRMEDVDPSFAGVTIFREGRGFAWRRGRRCGWILPGARLMDLISK